MLCKPVRLLFVHLSDRLTRFSKCGETPPTNPVVGHTPSESREEVIPTREEYGKPGDGGIRKSHEGKSKLTVHATPSNSAVAEDSPVANVDAAKQKLPRVTGTEPFEKWEREEMERLLGELRGNLGRILLPYIVSIDFINPTFG
jgi:phospholipase D1/2